MGVYKVVSDDNFESLSSVAGVQDLKLAMCKGTALDGKGLASFFFDGFMLCMCIAGSETMKVNGKAYEIVPGTVVFLSPNQLLEYGRVSDDFVCYVAVMSLELVLEFPSPVDIEILNMARARPVVHASVEEMAAIMEYYNFLDCRSSVEKGVYRAEITKTLLYAMMLKLCDIYRRNAGDESGVAKPRNEQLTDAFFVLLAHHYKKERSVKFYADCMNRTPKYLSGAVKRITGRSMPDWIDEVVVIEIKRQLKTTDRTILQISEDLNFSSPSVFVQYFKHHTGMTPLKYRKSGM